MLISSVSSLFGFPVNQVMLGSMTVFEFGSCWICWFDFCVGWTDGLSDYLLIILVCGLVICGLGLLVLWIVLLAFQTLFYCIICFTGITKCNFHALVKKKSPTTWTNDVILILL